MLHLHRIINCVAGGVVVFMIITLVVTTFRSPLVIVMRGQEKQYYQSERKPNSITEKDIENFVYVFIERMLSWEKLEPIAILKQVEPFITSGLRDKLRADLIERAEKDFKGKSLSEGVTNIKVQVTDKDVVASFDKVLRIDGIPLVIPAQMAFNIVRGTSTEWNPMGLYVNGIVEHERAK